jgi:O-antigen/teichoic acid export membrane protein
MQIKNKYINRFLQSRIVRNTSVLLSGNMLAQIITLAAYPIISRIYGPEELGTLNLFVSIFAIFVLLANAEYQNVLVFHKEEKDLPSALAVCLSCVALVSTIVLITVPFSAQISSLFGSTDLADWYFLMPIYVAATAIWNICDSLVIRKKLFKYISFYLVLIALYNVGLKILLGHLGWGTAGLIISAVSGSVFILILVLLFAQQRDRLFSSIGERPTWTSTLAIAREYIKFPKFSLSRKTLNMISKSLPIFLLSAHFGMAEIGLYSMGLLLAHTPINVACGSLYKIMFRFVSEKVWNKEKILPVIKKYIASVLMVGIPSFALLYFILPDLTSIILGENWRTSGEYIRLMLPWLLAFSISNVIDFLPQLFKRQEGLLIFEIIDIVCKLSVLLFGIYLGDFYITLIMFFMICFVINVFKIFWYITVALGYEKGLH